MASTELSAIGFAESKLPSERMVHFVRYLRQQGFFVGVRETRDALALVRAHSLFESARLAHCLRVLLCRNRQDWQQFPQIYQMFWFPEYVEQQEDAVSRVDVRRRAGGTAAATGLSGTTTQELENQDLQSATGAGAGRQNTLWRADFRFLTDRRDTRMLQTLAERLARRLRHYQTRRHKVGVRGERISLRDTLLLSRATLGEPIKLRYTRPRRQLPRLVVLQDVSHSMAGYSPMLTHFARGLLRVFKRSEAFVFHTELFRVTHLYRESDAMVLRQRLEAYEGLWMGGTQIAKSLTAFNTQYATACVDHHTIVLILSDGTDTDDPEDLHHQLAVLRSRAQSVVWINPLIGRRDPANEIDGDVTRGLSKSVDFVAPGHNIVGLTSAVDYLQAHC